MCGIVVAWDPTLGAAQRQAVVSRIAASLAHRGPDAQGVWTSVEIPVTLGHTRLAIRGLGPQGAQPMVDPLGRGVLVYNGELFGAEALRESLIGRGVRFRGVSDTELLLHALAEYGVDDALRRIRGQFAFVWLDLVERALYMARDRLGIRPLYYASDRRGRLCVASEQKALLPWPWLPRSWNRRAMLRYLLLARTDDVAGQTMLDSVKSLPPGHWARWDGSTILRRRYFRLRLSQPRATPSRVRKELERAVLEQLVSDVPLGVLVSGGLDSSAVAVLADRARLSVGQAEPMHVFAYHDLGAAADERPYQRAVIESLRSPTVVHWVSSSPSEFASDLETYVRHQEEPFGDASSYAEFCIARRASQVGAKVLLGGLGGDEVFVGYPSFAGVLLLEAVVNAEPHAVAAVLRGLASGAERAGFLHGIRALVAAGYYEAPGWLRNGLLAWRSARLAGLHMRNMFAGILDGATSWHGYDGKPRLNAALRAAIESWSIPRYLSHSDRMGAAHGVENRVPLLDDAVCETAFGLPLRHRVGGHGLKAGLRLALGGLLPPTVAHRRWKQGFHVPLARYVDALENPLREAVPAAESVLHERVRWTACSAPIRWRWGMLGMYVDSVARSPRIDEWSL